MQYQIPNGFTPPVILRLDRGISHGKERLSGQRPIMTVDFEIIGSTPDNDEVASLRA